MSASVEYVVLPATRGWVVRSMDSEEGFEEKDEAIGRAFALARRGREWRVIVLTPDGHVETELYGSTEAIGMTALTG